MSSRCIGAEQYARSKQFDYHTNSNLVLTAERSSRQTYGSNTSPTSLWGRVSGKMGDRAIQSRPSDRHLKDDCLVLDLPIKSQKILSNIEPKRSILPLLNVDTIKYKPRTLETRKIYETLLINIQTYLGDQPVDILYGAADEILAVIKNAVYFDTDKYKQIQILIGEIDQERFLHFLAIDKMINDYLLNKMNIDAKTNENDELGVSLEFDDQNEKVIEFVDHTIEDHRDQYNYEESVPLRVNLVSVNFTRKDEHDDINVQEIDAYWLQRQISKAFLGLMDAIQTQNISEKIFELLSSDLDVRDMENRLVMMLDFEKFDLIKKLIKNRLKIVWCTRLGRVQNDIDHKRIEMEMEEAPETSQILESLQITRTTSTDKQTALQKNLAAEVKKLCKNNSDKDVKNLIVTGRTKINFESLVFPRGSHFLAKKNCQLPAGSFRTAYKGYEEVFVASLKNQNMIDQDELVAITKLPDWAHTIFIEFRFLNLVQSKVYEIAFLSDENILLCAPTGSGKSNIALLAILHEFEIILKQELSINLILPKVIYVAPMKALVTEIVGNFSFKLFSYDIRVYELTGDFLLNKTEIAETQVIVTTPEKWDIITRKSYLFPSLRIKLFIIDEVHLLHDDRGSVIEAIVARSLKQDEISQTMTRMVGLSATLPNYDDVAKFINVNPDKGLFYFNNSFRPCPLEQIYVGITIKKPLQRFQLMNDICFEKIVERIGKYQILIFVHSRKETLKTAYHLKNSIIFKEIFGKLINDSISREILNQEASSVVNSDLKELLPYGLAIHNAGICRTDRTLVEDLFGDGHIQVVISTATLAWGVNLPAHTVIIKGTQVYNPIKSGWDELSILDVLQMLGRAGRPQFDCNGEGIIITSHSELQYYLALMNQQLNIESHFIGRLQDNINAEIVRGSISNIRDAAIWLGFTYFYVRMIRDPNLYGITSTTTLSDPTHMERREDLVHSAALQLQEFKIIKYDRRTGTLQATDIGCIASHYYVTYTTIASYNENLKSLIGEIELLNIFSMSDEFESMTVREEEKIELNRLINRVPVPIIDSSEGPKTKINVLLQAYISRLKLDGLALQADMIYIKQCASRLLRCLFEISLRRGWAQIAEKTLGLCKAVSWRIWNTQTPLRQFKGIPSDVLDKIERKDIHWVRYFELSSTDLGELIHLPKLGKNLFRIIQLFPRLEVEAHILPITRHVIKLNLNLTPDFTWDNRVHDHVESFWIFVEDADSNNILHFEYLTIYEKYLRTDHIITFTVPVSEPLAPQYFIHILSDKWLQSEVILPVSLRNLILPEKFQPNTELLDLQPLPISALENTKFESIYNGRIKKFNPIQTQVFLSLYHSDNNVFLAAPTGSGKTLCAEFAILRIIKIKPEDSDTIRCVYIAPYKSVCNEKYNDWRGKFGDQLGFNLVVLKGETNLNSNFLEKFNIIISEPFFWDHITRRWKQRKTLLLINLFIVDELQIIASDKGHIIETITLRMRYMSSQIEGHFCRIVAMSASIANAKDLARWCGTNSHSFYNFSLSTRPVPLQVEIRGFGLMHLDSKIYVMIKPAYDVILQRCNFSTKPAIVFVPPKLSLKISLDFLTFLISSGTPNQFLRFNSKEITPYLINLHDSALKHSLQYGIGYIYENQPISDRSVVEALYNNGIIKVLVTTSTICWDLPQTSHLVIIMGTQLPDRTEYPLSNLLNMIGKANRPGIDDTSFCVLMCHGNKKDYYMSFLLDSLPVESCLNYFLHDHLNSEIVNGTIEDKQEAIDYLTWTFYYIRLPLNPNYYGLIGNSHRHVSDHLSELVESILEDLTNSGCIIIEDNEVNIKPANLGRIAAHYNVTYTTVEIFKASIESRSKQKDLLEIMCACADYEEIPMRDGEVEILFRFISHTSLFLEKEYYDLHFKALALLKAHFSREILNHELIEDQKSILFKSSKLLSAMVDVIASEGWVGSLLATMELSQMVIQGMWSTDSPLLQLPHVTRTISENCITRFGHDSVYGLLNLRNNERLRLLRDLSDVQMTDLAKTCIRYPDIKMSVKILNSVAPGGWINIKLIIIRDWDIESHGIVTIADTPRFPDKKIEGWWIVGVDNKIMIVCLVKKVYVNMILESKGQFLASSSFGPHQLKIYLMCDSYIGCDQEYLVEYSIKNDTKLM